VIQPVENVAEVEEVWLFVILYPCPFLFLVKMRLRTKLCSSQMTKPQKQASLSIELDLSREGLEYLHAFVPVCDDPVLTSAFNPSEPDGPHSAFVQ